MEEFSQTAIQILEAAKELFAKSGFAAVSTKKIAKHAQVNEVTIFRLFGSKDKLFETILKYFYLRPRINQIAEMENLPLGDFMRKLGEILHEFFTANLTLIKIEIREGERVYNKKSMSNFSKVTVMLSSKIQQQKNVSKKQADKEAFCFMTGVYGMLLNLYVFRPINKKMKFKDCFETFVSKFE